MAGWLIDNWDMVSAYFAEFGEYFKGLWEGVASCFSGLWENLVGFVLSVWQPFSDGISAICGAVGSLFDFYTGTWRGVFSSFYDFLAPLFAPLVGVISSVWGEISSVFSTLVIPYCAFGTNLNITNMKITNIDNRITCNLLLKINGNINAPLLNIMNR